MTVLPNGAHDADHWEHDTIKARRNMIQGAYLSFGRLLGHGIDYEKRNNSKVVL